MITTESACPGYGGSYQGNGTLCDPNPCATSSVEGHLGSLALRHIIAVPNPSTGQVLVLYPLPKASMVTMEIFDASGSIVRRLEEGHREAGVHVTHWDGRNDAGVQLPSGAYFTRIQTPAGITTGRIVLAH